MIKCRNLILFIDIVKLNIVHDLLVTDEIYAMAIDFKGPGTRVNFYTKCQLTHMVCLAPSARDRYLWLAPNSTGQQLRITYIVS